MIGTLRPDRLTCGDDHYPGCYNPWSRDTYCICGDRRWEGEVGTWHSRMRRERVTEYTASGKPVEPPLLGWDTYFLHADHCPDRETTADLGHVCEEPC